MYEHVMVETLSGTFNAISCVIVYNVMLHVNAAPLRGLHLLFCVLYMKFRKIILFKIPPGGKGSIASSRPKTNI